MDRRTRGVRNLHANMFIAPIRMHSSVNSNRGCLQIWTGLLAYPKVIDLLLKRLKVYRLPRPTRVDCRAPVPSLLTLLAKRTVEQELLVAVPSGIAPF